MVSGVRDKRCGCRGHEPPAGLRRRRRAKARAESGERGRGSCGEGGGEGGEQGVAAGSCASESHPPRLVGGEGGSGSLWQIGRAHV